MEKNIQSSSYGPETGKIHFKIYKNQSDMDKRVTVYMTEHKPIGKKQYSFKIQSIEQVELLSGTYTLQTVLNGYEAQRSLVSVVPNKLTEVSIDFRNVAPQKVETTLASNLAKYGLKATDITLKSLTVKRGQKVILDRNHRNIVNTKLLKPTTVTEVKSWIGMDDKYFPGDYPNFGHIPYIESITINDKNVKERVPIIYSGRSEKKKSNDITLLNAIAKEYIYGNSKSVARFKSILDEFVLYHNFSLYVFFTNIITVEAGGHLVLGPGCNVLTCDELRVSTEGMIDVLSDATINTVTYQEF